MLDVKNNILPEDFINAGYRKFSDGNIYNKSSFGLQKAILDGDKIAYFINIRVYDYHEFTEETEFPRWGYQPEGLSYFKLSDIECDYSYDVISLSGFSSIISLEKFYEMQYVEYGRLPDIHNN